jgi:peptide/nickel transport system permease protein
MPQYTARRLLTSIPVLLGILVVVFLLARLIPGDACKAMLGEKATADACERFNQANGLDKPVINCIESVRPVRLGGCLVNPAETQFVIYASNLLQGDFGQSIRFSRPVTIILAERLPTTIELSLAALTIAIVVGIPLGVISAVKHNSAADVGTMVGANIGVSMPVFWLGLMLAYLFSVVLGLLPPSGRISAGVESVAFYKVWNWAVDPSSGGYKVLEFFANLYIFNSLITGQWAALTDVTKHLILPAVALATIPLAIIARMTRSSLLDILGQDYVRAAKAKGVPRNRVVLKHAFRNALLPVVTIIGLSLGGLLGGAVLTETVFGLAGVGRILFEAITARDYPIIQAFTLVIAIGYVIINLLVDLSYTYLDPRIRLK